MKKAKASVDKGFNISGRKKKKKHSDIILRQYGNYEEFSPDLYYGNVWLKMR